MVRRARGSTRNAKEHSSSTYVLRLRGPEIRVDERKSREQERSRDDDDDESDGRKKIKASAAGPRQAEDLALAGSGSLDAERRQRELAGIGSAHVYCYAYPDCRAPSVLRGAARRSWFVRSFWALGFWLWLSAGAGPATGARQRNCPACSSKQANERRRKQILAPPRRTRNRNDRRPGPTCRRRTAPPPKRPRNVRPLSSLREVDASVLLLIPTEALTRAVALYYAQKAYQWMSGYESTEAEGTGQRDRERDTYEY
jgi:hypothetical protein